MKLPGFLARNKLFYLAIFGVFTGAALILGLSMTSSRAYADACEAYYPPGGRDCHHGYFSYSRYATFGQNVYDNGIPSGVNSAAELRNTVRNYMDCSSYTSTGLLQNASSQHATGSAFIILTMLGYPAGTYKHEACQQYNRWSALIGDYEDANLIRWNVYRSWSGNTYHLNNMADDGWFVDSGSSYVIEFLTPDRSGVLYTIKRDCANPVGTLRPLRGLEPPTGSFSVRCNRVWGTAYDPDTPSRSTEVRIIYSSNGAPVQYRIADAATNTFEANPTPSAVQSDIFTVSVRVQARDTTTDVWYNLPGSPKTMGPCLVPEPTCTGFTITPSVPDPNTRFNITASVTYGSSAEAIAVLNDADGEFYLRVARPDGSYLYSNSNVTPVTRSGGRLSVTVNNLGPAGGTGLYTVLWGIAGSINNVGEANCGGNGTVIGPDGNPNPPAQFPVVDKPFFTIDGGDGSAGAGMNAGGVDCAVAANDRAGLVSWNRGSSAGYAGAGTQYAALALNYLQEFASGQSSSTYRPTRLSFANTDTTGDSVNVTGGFYGGKFGGMECTPDYFTNAAGVTTGNVTIGATSVANGSRQVRYVRGNVYISGNIAFSGSYANAGQVPSFTVVVEGNIYIAPNVTQLDGIYIAQPTSAGAGGNIYTCASAPFTAAPLGTGLFNTCNNPLIVNGSFSAKQVWLLRTSGTVTTTPSEQFNLSPEQWLSTPFGNGLNKRESGYDSITSLPPVL